MRSSCFAHFDLSHLLNLPGAVDVTLNPFDDSFEPISFTEAFACLDDPDKLRDKERISIVFDYNYWRQFAAFDAKITNYLASDADLQSRVTAIVATMRESARIGNPIPASDPYTIVVHARIGEQFKFKLKYSFGFIPSPNPRFFLSFSCPASQQCDASTDKVVRGSATIPMVYSIHLQDQRASSPRPSRAVLFSDGLWCIAANDAKPFHNPLLAKYLNRCYLADVKSAVDESCVGYTSAHSELAVQYFAHCDLLLHGLGVSHRRFFTCIIAKRIVDWPSSQADGGGPAPSYVWSKALESSGFNLCAASRSSRRCCLAAVLVSLRRMYAPRNT